jgi:phage terminase large subunit GpA-like protein
MLNSNLLKDDLNGRLDCVEPGRGMFRIADWFSDSLFNELCGEMRTPKGWMPAPGVRNEAWDLSYYMLGLCISELMRVEGIKWDSPPGWAAQWDTNDLVREAKNEPRFALGLKSSYDFAEMAKQLA